MPAITSNLNLTQIAIKRLSGKAMTNSNFTIAQEDLGSTVQTAAGTIFGEAIPPSPDSGSGKLNIIQSSSVGSPGTVQLVMLTVSAYGTEYQNTTNFTNAGSPGGPWGNADQGESTIETYHAYALRLTGSYEADNAAVSSDFNNLTSTPTDLGSFPYEDNAHLSGSIGRLQILPEYVGLKPGSTPNPYTPVLFNIEGNEITPGSEIDWYLDPYAGILFVQDPVNYNTGQAASIPDKLQAFIYTGKYQDQMSYGISDISLHISASEGTAFDLVNNSTASFTSGSGEGLTVTAGPTNNIEFELVNVVSGSAQLPGFNVSASTSTTNFDISLGDTASFIDGVETVAGNKVQIGKVTDNVQFANLTGSNLLITNTASITYFETTYESSSIIYSSGSTKFGDTNDDTHVFTGSVAILYTGSNGAYDAYGIEITGSGLHIEHDLSISASGDISASALYLTNEFTALDGGVTINSNTSPELFVGGNITASGDISASGLLFASASEGLGGSDIAVAMYNTVTGQFYHTGSSALGDTTLLEASASAGIFLSASEGTGFSIGLMQSASFTSGSGGGLTVEAGVGTNNIEFTLVGVLSSSQQIATDISGAIDAATGSVLLEYGLLSGSAQIATDISGAIDAATGSVLLEYGLLSGSAQIATEISGAIGAATASVLLNYGLLSGSAQIATDISGAIGAATASLSASIVGTANEVEVVGTLGGTIQIGLPDDVTISNNLNVNGNTLATDDTTFNLLDTNATTINFGGAATTLDIGADTGTTTIKNNAVVVGDLTVQGTTTSINTDQLLVQDPFILLASSSSDPNTDGGIIIQTNASAQGTALFYDNSSNRWALAESSSVAHNASSATAHQFVVSVSSSAANPTGTPSNFGLSGNSLLGMMYVATTDNDGDTNTIWIYG